MEFLIRYHVIFGCTRGRRLGDASSDEDLLAVHEFVRAADEVFGIGGAWLERALEVFRVTEYSVSRQISIWTMHTNLMLAFDCAT